LKVALGFRGTVVVLQKPWGRSLVVTTIRGFRREEQVRVAVLSQASCCGVGFSGGGI